MVTFRTGSIVSGRSSWGADVWPSRCGGYDLEPAYANDSILQIDIGARTIDE